MRNLSNNLSGKNGLEGKEMSDLERQNRNEPKWKTHVMFLLIKSFTVVVFDFFVTKSLSLTKSSTQCASISLFREFKKLRRLLQRKRHIKIELSVELNVFSDDSKLVTVNKRSERHFRLRGTNGFNAKAKNERFTFHCDGVRASDLTLYGKKIPQLRWKISLVNKIKRMEKATISASILFVPVVYGISHN